MYFDKTCMAHVLPMISTFCVFWLSLLLLCDLTDLHLAVLPDSDEASEEVGSEHCNFTEENRNFFRLSYLVQDISSATLQRLIKQFCDEQMLTFEQFLDQNKHVIFHGSDVGKPKKCDIKDCKIQNLNILKIKQWRLLYTEISVSGRSSSEERGPYDFQPRKDITEDVCDVTLANFLIGNIVELLLYTMQKLNPSVREFLNTNRHDIFHAMTKEQCYECSLKASENLERTEEIKETDWNRIFKKIKKECTKSCSCSCSFEPIETLTGWVQIKSKPILIRKLLQCTMPLRSILSVKNEFISHIPKASIERSKFNDLWSQMKSAIDEICDIIEDETFCSQQKKRIKEMKNCEIDDDKMTKGLKLIKAEVSSLSDYFSQTYF